MIKGLFSKEKVFTTIAGLIGAAVMALGFFLPEKFDPETQLEINTITNELLLAIGGFIELIAALVAKDPVLTPPAE